MCTVSLVRAGSCEIPLKLIEAGLGGIPVDTEGFIPSHSP